MKHERTEPKTAVRIRLLGPLAITREGEPISLPTRKAEALLAVLALRPGVAFTREWLVALLWPDVGEAQGRASLRQAVAHLRRALGTELFASAADRLNLEPTSAWVDVAEVERVLSRPPVDREPTLELFRGPLLDGFPAIEDPFTAWLSDERLRIGQRVADRMEECLAALSAEGLLERALAVGTWLVGIEPTRESVHRAIMQLHLERGDAALALRQYERCRELLDRHLGLRPSAETERLCRSITARNSVPPSTRTAAAPESAPGGGAQTLLVVHPFEPHAEDPSASLLARGLVEDLITELSRFRQLAVVSAAAERAHGAADRPRSGLALSGSVRIAGGRARLTASLVDRRTGLTLWAERWETRHDDFFGVLDRLTRNVVAALALRIDEARLSSARKSPRERLEVYECWLRGLECLRRGTPESDEEARGYFEQALARDPTFARAYTGISLSHFNDWSCQAWERFHERERLAFEYARRAVELDAGDHVTQCILAKVYIYRREFALGERHLEQAVTLNANDADILMHAAVGFAHLGDAERAGALADAALELNPRHPDWYYPFAALARFFARRLDDAEHLLLRAPDGLVDARAYLAAICALRGEREAAREHGARFLEHFRRKIVRDRPFSPAEATRWVLQVNPLRAEADHAYFLDGLTKAGLEPP